MMMLLVVVCAFVLGALTVVALEAIAALFLVKWLIRRIKKEEDKAQALASPPSSPGDLDPSYYNKQGIIWVVESEKIPKSWLGNKLPRDQKRKKDILDVTPIRKSAKVRNHSLILTESDGSLTEIRLKGCDVSTVSATGFASRKWAKRYPIRVENKLSAIYKGSKSLYIYLETSWEKESWCKALRLASCDDKEKLKWFAKLNLEFQNYLTSLNAGYPSFMKPSITFNTDQIDKSVKFEGSSSKVRQFLKKIAKKASKSGIDYKASWVSTSGGEERKVSDKSYPWQDSDSAASLMKMASTQKPPNSSSEDDIVTPLSASFTDAGSTSQMSLISDADSDERISGDEGSLCWNLLLSRFFFDAKANVRVKQSVQARIQRMLSNMRTPSYIGEVTCTGVDPGNIPPFIRAMRVLPSDMNEVWAFEVDIEYSGGATLDIETRLEIRELDLQGDGAAPEGSAVHEVTSDLLEGFEDLGKQLHASEKTVDKIQGTGEGEPDVDESRGDKSNAQPSQVSRWKSILQSVTKQVAQVPLSLGIRVASVRGTLRLYIRPPPSDQIWFGFTCMPDVDFNLQSFVGEQKITSGHLALFLINRFKAAIRETMVLPNCESLCVPWMLAEKDDWVPQTVAPFLWYNQEAASDSATKQAPDAQPREYTGTVQTDKKTLNHLTTNNGKLKEIESHIVPASNSVESYRSSSGAKEQPTGTISSLTESQNPELNEICQRRREENQESRSESRTVSLSEDHSHNAEEDDGRPRKLGTRARMLGLGKKMGEKLEEKRRNIEERGRTFVERMKTIERQKETGSSH